MNSASSRAGASRVVGHGALGAVQRGQVGAAAVVVIGHVHFILRHRVDQVLHARDRVRRVFAVRELVDQFLERGERFARRFRVALGRVLANRERSGSRSGR